MLPFLLTSCTTFHLLAKSQDDFRGLVLPRVKYEYGNYLKDAPGFEEESVVNLVYDNEGIMTNCELEPIEFPDAFKSRLCEYVFGKIKYLHAGDGRLKMTLLFKLKPE